eukprot:1839081-Pleurochrysis_carterae.AAC.2
MALTFTLEPDSEYHSALTGPLHNRLQIWCHMSRCVTRHKPVVMGTTQKANYLRPDCAACMQYALATTTGNLADVQWFTPLPITA